MDWLTATEALELMGTRPQTLYANVSRGRIRARKDPNDARKSHYWGNDVRKLAKRRSGQKRTEIIAGEAIKWGDPVLPSAISTIQNGHLYYRGIDAVNLAKSSSFEAVVALLWQVDDVAQIVLAAKHPALDKDRQGLLVEMASCAAADAPAFGRTLVALQSEAIKVLTTVVASVGAGGQGPLHVRLADHWHRPKASDGIRQALILLADHELNASTFAARVAASTGASLAASVLAGLCALSGPLHGGSLRSVGEIFELTRRQGPKHAVRNWLSLGRTLPGSGHRLYPDGDVRALALLECYKLPTEIEALKTESEATSGSRINIDFALAGMAAAFDLPEGSATTLFELGRSAGWLAHALEQSQTGHLIRPRARYVGPALQRREPNAT